MLLYHFTTYISLPDIMREGITVGEVPLVRNRSYKAANLTSNPSIKGQDWALKQCVGVNKCRVRLSVKIEDNQVQRFKDVMRENEVTIKRVRVIDPSYERPNWYFAFNGIPKDQIVRVEVFENGTFETFEGNELAGLIMKIEDEKQRIDLEVVQVFDKRFQQFRLDVAYRKGEAGSWLLDGLGSSTNDDSTILGDNAINQRIN